MGKRVEDGGKRDQKKNTKRIKRLEMEEVIRNE